jgi:hypothetical protein
MANSFGTDILIQADDPLKAANFYVKELGFEITDKKSNMISLHGKNMIFPLSEARFSDPSLKLPSKALRKPKQGLRGRAAE